MSLIRRIDLHDATMADWCAIDQLMIEQAYRGEFQETAVVIRYSGDRPGLSVGVGQDGDELDAAKAREFGHVPVRRFSAGGGIGFHTPELPIIVYYYLKPYRKPTATMLTEIDVNGEANAAALRRCGLEAQYRPIGDTEIVDATGTRVKVAANGVMNLGHPDLWMACTSLVWAPINQRSLAAIGAAVRVPKEKFEDKATKSVTARIMPISQALEGLGRSIHLEELFDAAIEENRRALMRGDRVERQQWRPEEQAFLAMMKPFFEGGPWLHRFSSRRLARAASRDARIGVAAYKSRKLVKASVALDAAGQIEHLMFTTDGYVRPGPILTHPGFLGTLSDSLRGLKATDTAAIRARLEACFADPEVEAPMLAAEDFIQVLTRAAQVAVPVAQYLEEN